MGQTFWTLRAMYFYPRPPRGGRLFVPDVELVVLEISIHALREEGDGTRPAAASTMPYFYPRPPRGGRPQQIAPMLNGMKFLSTPSARRATQHHGQRPGSQEISIHALREEGDLYFLDFLGVEIISIHALREEGDRFQQQRSGRSEISIHALREEGDKQ